MDTRAMVMLFVLLVVASGAGGLFGSIAGVFGGLIVVSLAAALSGRFGWIDKSDVTSVAVGRGGLAGRRLHQQRGRS